MWALSMTTHNLATFRSPAQLVATVFHFTTTTGAVIFLDQEAVCMITAGAVTYRCNAMATALMGMTTVMGTTLAGRSMETLCLSMTLVSPPISAFRLSTIRLPREPTSVAAEFQFLATGETCL